MKRPHAGDSNAKPVDLKSWFESRADFRANLKSSENPELYMTADAMSGASEFMSSDAGALLPRPLPILPRGEFGVNEIHAQMQWMFERVGVQHNERECMSRDSLYSRTYRMKVYTSPEVFEWMWSVVASHIDLKLGSMLPHLGSNRNPRRRAMRNVVKQDALLRGISWPMDDDEFTRAARAIVAMLPCPAPELLKPQDVDAVVDVMRTSCAMATGVDVGDDAIRDHIVPICTHVEPTAFLGMTLLRTDILQEVLGVTLASRVRNYAFITDWRQEPAEASHGDASLPVQAVLRELIETRKTLLTVKAELTAGNTKRAQEVCGVSSAMVAGHRVHARWSEQTNSRRREELHTRAVAAFKHNIACTAHIAPLVDELSKECIDRCHNVQIAPYCLILSDSVDLYVEAYLRQEHPCYNFSIGDCNCISCAHKAIDVVVRMLGFGAWSHMLSLSLYIRKEYQEDDHAFV